MLIMVMNTSALDDLAGVPISEIIETSLVWQIINGRNGIIETIVCYIDFKLRLVGSAINDCMTLQYYNLLRESDCFSKDVFGV